MNNEVPGTRFHGLLGNLGKLTSIRDTELVEQSLLRTLGPLINVLDTELYRLDESQTVVRVIYSHRSKVVDSDGGARLVKRIEEITNPSDIAPEVMALTSNVRLLRRPCTRRIGDEYMIAYPLLGDGEVRGYFLFKRDREVSPAEDTIIRGVLEVFSNYYALLDISMRDRLTGLLNRQALENSFDRIWTAVSRPAAVIDDDLGRRNVPSQTYWLAVIDIDHFKRINDTYGHMVGDEILLLVARLMTSIFRSTDLLYRYGGEEFVAIVNAENSEIARAIFERVRLGIAGHHFPRIDSLTMSIGFALITPNLLPVEVLGRADRSLYQAKQDGRNRTYDYQELVDAGIFKDVDYAEPELF
ncbi:MAG: GGDEF domain-containing protein [Thiobacillus sp.]|nr:GGDEF domain-containing protein [Thiobacillus sp.]